MCFVSSGETVTLIGQYQDHVVCSDIDDLSIVDIDQAISVKVVGYASGS